jgi:toxin-antitoxin system PIN domain toxin
MRALADVNILLALGDPLHSSSPRVSKWFDSLPAGSELLVCRSTQTSLLRLLATSAVMQGKPLSLKKAWNHVDALISAPGIGFAKEPEGIDKTWKGLCQPFPASPKVVADAYLAAFAIENGVSLATLDSGFRQFAGVRIVEALFD